MGKKNEDVLTREEHNDEFLKARRLNRARSTRQFLRVLDIFLIEKTLYSWYWELEIGSHL